MMVVHFQAPIRPYCLLAEQKVDIAIGTALLNVAETKLGGLEAHSEIVCHLRERGLLFATVVSNGQVARE